jgi:hypothetical protein
MGGEADMDGGGHALATMRRAMSIEAGWRNCDFRGFGRLQVLRGFGRARGKTAEKLAFGLGSTRALRGGMAVVFYTDRLWRSLVRPPRTHRTKGSTTSSGRLAPWYATATLDQDPNLVIAVAGNSGLTLAFETRTLADFPRVMAAALERVFADMKLPNDALAAEVADVREAAFARLRGPEIRDELEFVEFEACTMIPYCEEPGAAVQGRLQLALNEVPRANRVPFEPIVGVQKLFASASTPTVH